MNPESDDSFRIRIITPRIEHTKEGLTYTILGFCQMCDQQITKNVYTNPENPTPEQEAEMIEQRHKDAQKAGDIFADHLENEHPTGVDIRLFHQAS